MRKTRSVKLVLFNLMVFFFVFSSFFNLEVKADNVATGQISEITTIDLIDYDAVYHQQDFYYSDMSSMLSGMTEDTYYRANYTLSCSLGFNNYVGSLDTFTLTFDVLDSQSSEAFSFVLIHNTEQMFGDNNFVFEDSGSFIFPGDFYSLDLFSSSVSFSLSEVESYTDELTCFFTSTLTINSIEQLSPADVDIYQKGFEVGYDEGRLNGYLAGESSGFNTGYNDGFSDGYEFGADSVDTDSIFESGYDSGYDSGLKDGIDSGYNSGFKDGKESINTDIYFEEGYESGYTEGLLAGSASVDTDIYYDAGYNTGFEDGAESVDTSSFFNAGYMQGHNEGYTEGYDDGYSKGYAEALETLDVSNSSSLEAGTSKTYSFSQSINEELSFKSANTPFSSFVYESGGYGEIYNFIESEGYLFDDGEFSHYGSIDGEFEYDPYYRGYLYNMSSIRSLFRASPEVYAYKIILTPKNVSLETDSVYWLRSMFGTYSDVQACSGEYGHLIIDGSTQHSSIWLVTDYSDIYICIGYLAYYQHSYNRSASYSLDWNFDVEVIPYTKNEYNAAVPAIEKQTLEIKQQTEAMKEEMHDLKHGYDSSVGEQANNKLSNSLNIFSSMEDSLFTSATEHLDQFQIFDHNLLFAEGAPLSASLTFVTSLMTSTFIQMGGADGASGIVLSILFTVVLVSLALGIYKFYSGKKGGGG